MQNQIVSKKKLSDVEVEQRMIYVVFLILCLLFMSCSLILLIFGDLNYVSKFVSSLKKQPKADLITAGFLVNVFVVLFFCQTWQQPCIYDVRRGIGKFHELKTAINLVVLFVLGTEFIVFSYVAIDHIISQFPAHAPHALQPVIPDIINNDSINFPEEIKKPLLQKEPINLRPDPIVQKCEREHLDDYFKKDYDVGETFARWAWGFSLGLLTGVIIGYIAGSSLQG